MSLDEEDGAFSAAMFRGFVFRNTMHNSFDAQEIIDGVYLGSYDAARADLREFEKRNIRFVLTVGDDLEPQHLSSGVSYLLCRCDDVAGTTLLPNFDIFHEFIRCARQAQASVLVHCLAGISRSTTTVASFMMKEDSATFESVMRRIREHRVWVSPNIGFERQLRSYEFVTTGNEEARENFAKFSVKSAPTVQLANGVLKQTVTAPNEVREFLVQNAGLPAEAATAASVSTTATTPTTTETDGGNGETKTPETVVECATTEDQA